MSIPKKIHYCWFGGAEKSDVIKRCISSWKKHLPDYEILEWNESTFDVESNNYVKQAYDRKKWAFVSDYVRLWALLEFGGVYLDTDVMVYKSLDPLLEHKAFTGFENYAGKISPITAVMGAEKGHPWIARLIKDYDELSFINENGGLDLETNTSKIAQIMIQEYGVVNDDTCQLVKNGLYIYSSDYLCNLSSRSYTQHLFAGSWLPPIKRMKNTVMWAIYYLKRILIGGAV